MEREARLLELLAMGIQGRASLASSESLTKEDAALLAFDGDNSVGVNLARNPVLPSKIQVVLAKNDSLSTCLLKNPSLCNFAMEILLKKPLRPADFELLGSRLPKELQLAAWGTDRYWTEKEVWKGYDDRGWNFTPPKLFQNQQKESLRQGILKSSQLDTSLIDKGIKDRSSSVRAQAASLSLTKEQEWLVLNDQEPEVRKALAASSTASEVAHLALAADLDQYVLYALGEHTPYESVQLALANSKTLPGWYSMTNNPNLCSVGQLKLAKFAPPHSLLANRGLTVPALVLFAGRVLDKWDLNQFLKHPNLPAEAEFALKGSLNHAKALPIRRRLSSIIAWQNPGSKLWGCCGNGSSGQLVSGPLDSLPSPLPLFRAYEGLQGGIVLATGVRNGEEEAKLRKVVAREGRFSFALPITNPKKPDLTLTKPTEAYLNGMLIVENQLFARWTGKDPKLSYGWTRETSIDLPRRRVLEKEELLLHKEEERAIETFETRARNLLGNALEF